jgi:hypothetical protein
LDIAGIPRDVQTVTDQPAAVLMRFAPDQSSVEALLTREARSSLPLSRQMLLYLDPFAFFKDATVGTDRNRELALSYNVARRGILLTYVRRWLLIAAASFLGIGSAEGLAAHVPLFIIPAAGFGIGCSIAVAVATWCAAAYLLLSTQAVRR